MKSKNIAEEYLQANSNLISYSTESKFTCVDYSLNSNAGKDESGSIEVEAKCRIQVMDETGME